MRHLQLWEESTFLENNEENSALDRNSTDQSYKKEHRTWQEIAGNMFVMEQIIECGLWLMSWREEEFQK